MTDDSKQVQDLEERLRLIRFRPRASLDPELLGRLRRGDQPARYPRFSRRYLAIAAGVVLVGGAVLASAGSSSLGGVTIVVVDRCCYDLDGGGYADDGVLIRAEPDAKVHRLRVYEDLDRSASYTSGDVIRHDRGEAPSLMPAEGTGLVTIQRCCVDLDGGGPDDDGLLVLGIPPNRVMMAAIYETGRKPLGKGEGLVLR